MSKSTKAQEEAQGKNASGHDENPQEEGRTETSAPPAIALNTVKPTAVAVELASLTTLADRHRIASWQQAALMRHMGWDEGKMVSNADYERALRALKQRRMGGGCKE